MRSCPQPGLFLASPPALASPCNPTACRCASTPDLAARVSNMAVGARVGGLVYVACDKGGVERGRVHPRPLKTTQARRGTLDARPWHLRSTRWSSDSRCAAGFPPPATKHIHTYYRPPAAPRSSQATPLEPSTVANMGQPARRREEGAAGRWGGLISRHLSIDEP